MSLSSQPGSGLDMRTVEAAKENIQPVKTGRKQEALKKALTDTGATVRFNKQIEEARYNFETEIEKYQGDDPLEPFLRYIKWTQESFIEGSQSGLLELLNRACNSFSDQAKYKNDSRYLDIWLLYCDMVRDPKDIYSFLEHHQIGTKNYLLYRSWSRYLEDIRAFDRAEEVLTMGIDRKAQPEELMKTCLQAFEARMYQRMKRKQERQAQGFDDSDEETSSSRGVDSTDRENAGQRRALGALRGTGSVRAYEPPVGLDTLSGRKRAAPTTQSSNNNNASGFSIFVDEDTHSDQAKRRRLNSAGGSAPGGASKPEWASLPSETEKHKENRAMPSKWTGVSMPQDALAKAGSMRATAASGASSSKQDFVIFQDEEAIAANQRQQQGHQYANPSALKLRMVESEQGGSGFSRRAADIQSNPLKPLPYRFKVVTQFYEKGTNEPRMNSEGQMEISRYDRTAVYPGDGKEYSFEEIRAARWYESRQAELEQEIAPAVVPATPVAIQQPQPVLMSPFIAPATSAAPPSSAQAASILFSPAPALAAQQKPIVAESPLLVNQQSSIASGFNILADSPAPLQSNSAALASTEAAPIVPFDKENVIHESSSVATKKPRAPFRERTVILASSAAAAPVHQETPKAQARTNRFIDDEPEPTATGMMTVHTREALANFIDIFNGGNDRSIDASNDAEMTTGLVTSLIQVKNPSTGFSIFDESAATPAGDENKPNGGFTMFEDQPQPAPMLANSGGFAIFADSPSPVAKPAASSGFSIFADSPSSASSDLLDDQENKMPPGSQEIPVMRRSGVAFAPISDGSVEVDPSAIAGPFYEEDSQPQSNENSSENNSSSPASFFEAPRPAASNPVPSFESLIDSSPLLLSRQRPAAGVQAQQRGQPTSANVTANLSAANASFAVTPFGNTSRAPAQFSIHEDDDDDEQEAVEAEHAPAAQRVLDFDYDDLLGSPRNSEIGNRNIVNSPLSPLSLTRKTGAISTSNTGRFNMLDNTAQFTISSLDVTGNFDLDTKQLGLTSLLSASVLKTKKEEPKKRDEQEEEEEANFKTVSFKNSMHTVKIPAGGARPSSSGVVDPYTAMSSQLGGMMSELNLSSSSSFTDLSTQQCPEFSGVASLALGNKKVSIIRELPSVGPVGSKLMHVDLAGSSSFLRSYSKASAWEFYTARRLHQKLSDAHKRMVVSPSHFVLYRDASVVCYPMQYAASVQELVPRPDMSMPEENMAAYCCWHLLDLVDAIHSQGIIVGNLSARNIFMLNGALQSSTNFKPGGSEWAFRAPSITDLSKAIDTKSFAADVMFNPAAMSLPPQLQEVVASRQGCSFEIDALAICDIAHQLLFGKPIAVEMDNSGKWRVPTPFKSFWKAPWAAFFDGLLNVTGTEMATISQSLKSQIEKYFSSNPGKLRSLQTALSNLKQ